VQYHLGSDSLSTAVDNCSLFGRAPGPSPLVLYVFSCCIRNPWHVARCILLHFLSTPFLATISLVLWVSLPLVLYFGPIAVNFFYIMCLQEQGNSIQRYRSLFEVVLHPLFPIPSLVKKKSKF
jgi:hypothetical protein